MAVKELADGTGGTLGPPSVDETTPGAGDAVTKRIALQELHDLVGNAARTRRTMCRAEGGTACHETGDRRSLRTDDWHSDRRGTDGAGLVQGHAAANDRNLRA